MDRFDDMRMKGINTNDATAVASDILEGKTAYASGQKLIGTLKQGGGGGSSGYNVFVQQSEPESKDGVWIKSNGSSNNVYFSPRIAKKGYSIDKNFSDLNQLNDIVGQCVVGDYLYVFGNNSANSYKYNLKTGAKTSINVPTIYYSSSSYIYGAIYCSTKNSIYVAYDYYNYSASAGNCYSDVYEYHIDTNTYEAVCHVSHSTRMFLCQKNMIIYDDILYIFVNVGSNSSATPSKTLSIDTTTNKIISSLVKNDFVWNSIANPNLEGFASGKYLYMSPCQTISDEKFYIARIDVSTMTKEMKSFSNPFRIEENNSILYSRIIVIGTKIYAFSNVSSKYAIIDWDTGEIEVIQTNFSFPFDNYSVCVAYDEARGTVYFHKPNTDTKAFQLTDNNLDELPNGTALVIQDLSGLHTTTIENNSQLTIGIKNAYIVNDGELNEHITFYGNGENWRVISNPNGETATVSFNTNGGTSVEPIEVVIGQKLLTKPETTRSGNYLFEAWYLGDEPFDFNTEIIKDITLTAHWLAYEEVDYIESSGT